METKKRKYTKPKNRKPHPNKGKNLYEKLTPEQKEKHKKAMQDNIYWKFREKDGRSKMIETTEQAEEMLSKYFEWVNENPIKKPDFIRSGEYAGKIIYIPVPRIATIEEFCNFHGFTSATFRNYESNENYKEFFSIFTYIRERIDSYSFAQTSAGNGNPMLTARKQGLKDKQDLTTNDKDLTIGKIEFVSSKEIKDIGDSLEKDV
jgi:hypothetical protein